MKAIGGYFGLESRKASLFHDEALRFNSARNAFQYLLLHKKFRHIYLPAYCCKSLLEAIRKTNTDFSIYHINMSFEIEDELPKLDSDDAILYVNYFGLKKNYIKYLYRIFQNQLIIDNSQAFFDLPVASDCPTFYSPRKFFGVADGGFLYANNLIGSDLEKDISIGHVEHLMTRVDVSPEAGFEEYQRNEEAISNRPMKLMSKLTTSILSNIDFGFSERTRRQNFFFLHKELNTFNCLTLDYVDDSMIPMVYPFLVKDHSLRKKLIENRIYVAMYWPHTIAPLTYEESDLQRFLIPLPIDQRYNGNDMYHIVKTIHSCI